MNKTFGLLYYVRDFCEYLEGFNYFFSSSPLRNESNDSQFSQCCKRYQVNKPYY